MTPEDDSGSPYPYAQVARFTLVAELTPESLFDALCVISAQNSRFCPVAVFLRFG